MSLMLIVIWRQDMKDILVKINLYLIFKGIL